MFEDTYKYDSISVAKFLISEANRRKIFMNITKVQKLLYVVYGAYLRMYGERLVDEHPQAWPYGPVFPNTRLALKDAHFIKITSKGLDELVQDERLRKAVDITLSHFGGWTAGQLTEWSHGDGTPWDIVQNRDTFDWGDVIPDKLIFGYFKSIMVERDAN